MSRTRNKHQLILSFTLVVSMVLVLLAVAVRPSQAAVGDLVFTIEAPGVQQSQVSCPSGLGLETFDSVTLGGYTQLTGALGGYSAAFIGASLFIQDQSQIGGAEVPASQTPRFVTTVNSYELTLDAPAGYFGFWWSAGDGSNKVTVKMADGSSQVFTTQSILDSGSLLGSPGAGLDGHYGNPTQAFLGQIDTEIFVFVNIFATNPNAKITSLLFEQVQGSQGQFESDNHTACADILDPNTGSPVPQIGSITIVKEATPESEQQFVFFTSIGGVGSSFQLKDNGTDPNSITFSNLPPGVYNVFEQVPAGWAFVDPVECSGGADITIGGRNISIILSGGEDVTCTYNNIGPVDYGDVPDSYGTLAASNGPSHPIVAGLHIGAEPPDAETDGIPSTNADGDDNNATPNDEGSISAFPPLDYLSGSYSLPVPVNNQLASAAVLYGWIDFDANGVFDTTEFAQATVQPNDTSATLTWSGITPSQDPTLTGLYGRVRLTTGLVTVVTAAGADGITAADARAGGAALDGEVEGFIVPFTSLPVTLSWFKAERNGEEVLFRWQTATETGTAGFNILAVTGDGPVQLNQELIESKAINSTTPLDYAFTAQTTAASFFLQEVELTGATNNHGPFTLGVPVGSRIPTDSIGGWTILLPYITLR